MTETVHSQFAVKDVVNGDIWLKDLQRGLTVAVEAGESYYATPLRQQIRQLSEGDVIDATLKSQNELHTIWTFETLTVKSQSNVVTA
jgi:hypothetical protein